MVVAATPEAFPYDFARRYLISDRYATFNTDVLDTAKCFGAKLIRTSFTSPWQNGIASAGWATAAAIC